MTTTRYTTRREGDRWSVDDSQIGLLVPGADRSISSTSDIWPLSEAEAKAIAQALNDLHATAASLGYICQHGVNRYYVDCGACGDYGKEDTTR